jgi:hypothetical protein
MRKGGAGRTAVGEGGGVEAGRRECGGLSVGETSHEARNQLPLAEEAPRRSLSLPAPLVRQTL